MKEAQAMDTIQTLLSVPQVADLLGKDRTTIWRWVRDGRLTPTAYVGATREPVFDRAAIAALIETTQPQEAATSAA